MRIVALDAEGKPRFESLMNRGPQKGTPIYLGFDLIKFGDVDLREEPLRKWKEKLKRFLKNQPQLATLVLDLQPMGRSTRLRRSSFHPRKTRKPVNYEIRNAAAWSGAAIG